MDKFSSETRSRIMSCIRSSGTQPEVKFHNYLNSLGIRHIMQPKIHGNPDVYIYRKNEVIFINGCFWHGCRRHFKMPKSNRTFWKNKIKNNIIRQKTMIAELKKIGFGVRVIWEHDIK